MVHPATDPDASEEPASPRRLRRLLTKASKIYQPLYGLPDLTPKSPLRPCDDRCAALDDALSPALPDLHVLDIGCSLGYISHYFANRGATVHGIDRDATYIAICREIGQLIGSNATFELASFDEHFVDAIEAGRYDTAFAFSLLHHIIEARGIETVQCLVAKLLEKIPTVFVETALAEEIPPPGYTWNRFLPADELTIFAWCDGASIDLIGRFATHVGPVRRPVYRISARSS